MPCYFTPFWVEFLLTKYAVFQNVIPRHKSQIGPEFLVHKSEICDKRIIPGIVLDLGLGRKITAVVIGLKGFVYIKLPAPDIIGRCHIVLGADHAVEFIFIFEKVVILKSLAVNEKDPDILTAEDFALQDKHHVVV